MDELDKEIKQINLGIDFLEDHQSTPVGFEKSSGHIIWEVKMDFTRKAQWVKDGHKTEDPLGSNYSGVVSRDSV